MIAVESLLDSRVCVTNVKGLHVHSPNHRILTVLGFKLKTFTKVCNNI